MNRWVSLVEVLNVLRFNRTPHVGTVKSRSDVPSHWVK